MKHYGDITKLHGYDLPPVDVVTGGSPCQDLSNAGSRSGLSGSRSSLFMEQIRIVKEMRERDRKENRTAVNIRPRYMVWENVPGALSTNGGKDFQRVLTEIVRIAAPVAPDVPLFGIGGGVVKNGQNLDAYTMNWADGALLTEYMTRSFGESPREENVSHLSQILQDSAPQKFYLSARACSGILNRAKKRNKELPDVLRKALKSQAGLCD